MEGNKSYHMTTTILIRDTVKYFINIVIVIVIKAKSMPTLKYIVKRLNFK